jgi:hypothetical protein
MIPEDQVKEINNSLYELIKEAEAQILKIIKKERESPLRKGRF